MLGARVPRGIKKRFWIFLQTTLAFTVANVPVCADPSVPINAEDLSKLLRGITEVGIMVDHLDEDTRTCGITEDLVKSTIEHTLKKNIPVTITDVFQSNADVYIKITTNYIAQVDVCLSSIEMEIKKLVGLEDGNNTVTGLVTIWSAGNLSSGSRPNYPRWFQENLSKGLTQLSSDWLLQNQ
jgi:pyocin large subunit-like protein